MKKYRIIWGVAIGVLIALLVGAMLSFYPLIGMKIIYREIAFCYHLYGNRYLYAYYYFSYKKVALQKGNGRLQVLYLSGHFLFTNPLDAVQASS